MATGVKGTFVISWSQTVLDGLSAAPVSALAVGSSWAWQGEAVRVDGPNSVLQLDRTSGEADLRQRAARMVRRLAGAAMDDCVATRGRAPDGEVAGDFGAGDRNFVVTDGIASYTATLIDLGRGVPPLLMFLGDLPPRGADLWIVHHTLDAGPPGLDAMTGEGGVICFTPGTRIALADGRAARVEELAEGDRVQTKDSAGQEIRWIGRRRMSGARLFAMPKLRPVRIRAGAFGIDRPDDEFLVSPEHRMLVRGAVARALFNTPEVLVSARDLVNGDTVTTDMNVKEVTYIHLLLPRHEIVFANGVETESFHPAQTALGSLDPRDFERLRQLMPQVEAKPQSFGAAARRNLTASEAAILLHEAA
ncbi:hypothetical protein ROJ8625_02407 [Roseivivax jejudonensis]|uniref:Hedgehog/Intein (Hint) domain-containing protein n=1 Tax=Roseivivax jejudonensis TaxID=1529041 RepID=A0A1X6ZDU8_9RHOB|nr:Hint domain-containing protein [Roseivivax jejudonensis]SLN49009.1 hypothetical protein ROJ8625_02407 [Roseivivax jejudonensis]